MPQTGGSISLLPRWVWLWAPALVSLLVVALTAWSPWLSHAHRIADWSMPDAEVTWIPAASSRIPRYPMQDEVPKRLGTLPFGDPAPVQISTRFHLPLPATAPVAVLLPATDGSVQLALNGVPQDAGPQTDMQDQPRPDTKQRLWILPQRDFRAVENRIDILVSDARLLPIRGPIYLGPKAVLEPIVVQGVRSIEAGHRIALWLCMLALALNLIAVAVGACPAHLATAALFAATGTRLFVSDSTVGLGQFGSVADQLLLACMLLCAAAAFRFRARPAAGKAGRIEIAILSLAVALGAVSLLAVGVGMEGAVRGGAATIAASVIYLAWALHAIKPKAIPQPIYRRILWGSAVGFGGVAVFLAVAGGTGIKLVDRPFAAEIGLVFSLAALSAFGTGFGAVAAGQRIRAILRDRLDQARVIRQQKETLAATALALNEMSRETAILEERQRMARDVHDGIGGQLASLIAGVRLRRVGMDDVERGLMSGLSELRLLVDSLDLVGGTLADALSGLLVRIRQQTAACGMHLDWKQADDLDMQVRDSRWILNLYRIIQEAISNAMRHSRGDRIAVSIDRPNDAILAIRIEDNGTSFDPAAVAGGRGLINMTHRAEEAGGSIAFDDAPAAGARVRIELPIPR